MVVILHVPLRLGRVAALACFEWWRNDFHVSNQDCVFSVTSRAVRMCLFHKSDLCQCQSIPEPEEALKHRKRGFLYIVYILGKLR